MNEETIHAIGAEEQERLGESRKNFIMLHPEPVLEDLEFEEPVYVEPTFRKEFGIQSMAMWLSVIGSMITSAITVGLTLFISAVRTDQNLLNMQSDAWLISFAKIIPLILFFAGTVAVEGYALAHGLAIGREKGKEFFSPWALLATFSIMSFSGLFRSFGLTDITNELVGPIYDFVTGGVVISTGLGVGVIIYFGSINIGAFTSKFETKKKNSKTEFHEELKKAKEQFQTEKEELYENYQKHMEKWYADFEKYYRSSAEQLFGVDRTKQRSTTNKNKSVSRDETGNVMASVREYLKNSNILPREVGKNGVISVNRICEELGIVDEKTKNNVSVYIAGFKNQEIIGKW